MSVNRHLIIRLSRLGAVLLLSAAVLNLSTGYFLWSPLSGEGVSPALASYSSVTFSGSGNNDMTLGGTFSGSVDTYYKVQIDSKSGSITAFAFFDDGLVQVTSAAHGLANGNSIKISGTTNYNGTFTVNLVATNTFIIAANYVSNDATGVWEISPNTFKWSDDGGSTWDATVVTITGSAQTLNNSVTVTFGATTGHRLNDYWTFTAYPPPTYTPKMNNWRWYADEASTTPTTAYAAEDTAPPQIEMGKNIPLKLRINLTETGGVAENNSRKKLYYNIDGAGSIIVGETSDTDKAFRYYNGGGSDNGVLDAVVLSDSSSSSKGIYNESNSNSPSNSDHPASTTVEFEYCIESYSVDPGGSHTVTFALYDQTLAAMIPLASGKSYPTLTTAIYDLSINSPSSANLGSWQIGSSAYATYTFAGGEEITVRDNRGLTGSNSSGWTFTASVSTEFSCAIGYEERVPSKRELAWWPPWWISPAFAATIPASDMYWITNATTALYAAPTTGISEQSGSYMTSAVTAASVTGSGYNGLGGFTYQPTVRVYNAIYACNPYIGVLTLTIV